jgi:hypothetical protein
MKVMEACGSRYAPEAERPAFITFITYITSITYFLSLSTSRDSSESFFGSL